MRECLNDSGLKRRSGEKKNEVTRSETLLHGGSSSVEQRYWMPLKPCSVPRNIRSWNGNGVHVPVSPTVVILSIPSILLEVLVFYFGVLYTVCTL